MQPHKNPLLQKQLNIVADMESIQSPTTFSRNLRERRREIRDSRRAVDAEAAIAGFSKEVSIYGFTKGQFSLIQLITATLGITGPASLVLSTWTAANQDVSDVLEFCECGLVTSSRWLVDLTFTKRSPQLATRIRQTFGDDAIRVAKNHAKYALVGNDEWKIVIHTSMNLNHNPRFENFEIAHDPELYAFHEDIANEIWQTQSRAVDAMRPYEIHKHFDAEC